MNVGRYIFAQITDFIPRYVFDKAVKKYKGDFHVKDLTCYNQFLHLLFGQLTGCDSLRDICLCLDAHKDILYHLGFRNTVTVSSLSRANENRDYRIYEELGRYLIDWVRPLYANVVIPDIITDPVNIHITDGKWHDDNMWELLPIECGAIYAADKAYIDLKQMWRMQLAGAFFVMRPKDNMRFEVTREFVATLIRVSALERTDLRELLAHPNDSNSSNQNVKEPTLFNDL